MYRKLYILCQRIRESHTSGSENGNHKQRCTVVRLMKESIGKLEIRPPVKSQPLKISGRVCTRDYVGDGNYCAFFVKIGSVGASPK